MKADGNPFLNSFWNGRLGQSAFELGMTKEEKNLQTIPVKSGLVAFFDILGFKEMLSANPSPSFRPGSNRRSRQTGNFRMWSSPLKTLPSSSSFIDVAVPRCGMSPLIISAGDV
jgi:hypothetical protein